MIEEEFPLPVPLLRFSKKPLGLLPTLQRLTSHLQSRVPCCYLRRLILSRDRLLSWVFPSLGRLPPCTLSTKHLPSWTPFSPFLPQFLSERKTGGRKVSLYRAWLSPHTWGAGPFDVSRIYMLAACSEPFRSIADYFFISRIPRFLQTFDLPLFATNPSSC